MNNRDQPSTSSKTSLVDTNVNEEEQFQKRFIRYRQDLIRQLVTKSFANKPKTKLNAEAQRMMTEMVRLFVMEACMRAAEQASDFEGMVDVNEEHLKKVLPQLVFDFS